MISDKFDTIIETLFNFSQKKEKNIKLIPKQKRNEKPIDLVGYLVPDFP